MILMIYNKVILAFSFVEVIEEEVDNIFTIHSVKGGTLRSVLLVDFNSCK